MDKVRETWGIDLRSLSLLRILLGCMLLVDHAIRAWTMEAHYTDLGVMPRAYQKAHGFVQAVGRFSLHMASGGEAWQWFLFFVAVVFACLLIIGYQTRLATFVSWLMIASLQNRNIEIDMAGDSMLRLTCMWAIFLPLGARWSLDARRAQEDTRPKNSSGNQYFSLATVALLVQMSCVYFFSAVHKDHPIWRKSAQAVHYALHIDSYDTWVGELLRQFPLLTTAITRLTLNFEFAGPFFLFGFGMLGLLPRVGQFIYPGQNVSRSLVSLAFISFHLGLASSLSLGTFGWFAALIWCGLFPTFVWTWGEQQRVKVKAPWLLRAVTFLETWALWLETPQKPAQEQAAWQRRVAPWVVRLRETIVGILLLYTLLWNLRTVDVRAFDPWISGKGTFAPDARPLIYALSLAQHWGLFAPFPRTVDGYFVVVGRQKDGTQVDILRKSQKVSWEKPDDVSESYESFRWRLFFSSMRRPSRKGLLPLYANYVCRTWNKEHPENPVLKVDVYFMARTTLAEGGHTPAKKQHLWLRSCPQP